MATPPDLQQFTDSIPSSFRDRMSRMSMSYILSDHCILSIFLSYSSFMHKSSLSFFLFAIALSLSISAPACADRPAWAGNHKDGEHGHSGGKNWNKGKNHRDYQGHQNNQGDNGNHQGGSRNYRSGNYVVRNFDNRQRTVIYDYFGPSELSSPTGLSWPRSVLLSSVRPWKK